MAQLFPTSVLPSLVALVLCLVAMSAAFVYFLPEISELFLTASQEYALFEPGCRHVASDIMGTNRANPTAMILSATMMLRHLGCASCLISPQLIDH
jgi:hypothetical protein